MAATETNTDAICGGEADGIAVANVVTELVSVGGALADVVCEMDVGTIWAVEADGVGVNDMV